MISGHCFCGAIEYEAQGPASQETFCHCETCRRTSGAPVVAWLTVPIAGFKIVSGTPSSFHSSEHGVRTFCASCGTALTFRSTKFLDEIDVTACSLDDPELLPPKDHTFVRSKLSWLHVNDGLPRHATTRSS